MKSLATTPLILALLMLLTPASAFADEPIEPLRGSWRAEQLGDTVPPANVLMYITFIDHENLKMDIIAEEGTEQQFMRYTATAEGAITFYPEPDTNPDGEAYTWAFDDDGKLVMTDEDDEQLIFSRYTPQEE